MPYCIMDLQTAIMKRFLRKLVNLNIWGGRHTEIKNLQKSLPDHLRGTKEHKQAIKELERDQWIITAMKSGEVHYSLNPQKTDEILQFYEKNCKDQ